MAQGIFKQPVVRRSFVWQPQIYDLDTWKANIGDSEYYIIDGLYVCWFSIQLTLDIQINTMLQIRGCPMNMTLFGTLYSNLTGSVGSTNQITTGGRFYPRPNITGKLTRSSWFTSCIIGVNNY